MGRIQYSVNKKVSAIWSRGKYFESFAIVEVNTNKQISISMTIAMITIFVR